MRCEEALQAVLDARYEGKPAPEEALEVLKRAECSGIRERAARLEQLMAVDDAHRPGPGCDTRFFARLEAERAQARRGSRSRWYAWAAGVGSVAVAAALLVILNPQFTGRSPANDRPIDVAMLEELELLESMELVEQLDEVEAYELLAAVPAEQLDSLIEEQVQ